MEEIKEILGLVKEGKVTSIESHKSFDPEKERLTYLLYNGIKDGELNTDEEAIKTLYPEGDEGGKYKMLKKRLKDRLFESIYYHNPDKYPIESHAHHQLYCYKNLIIGRLLVYHDAAQAGYRLLKRVLHRAQEYEVYEVAVQAAALLRHESYMAGDVNSFSYYDSLSGSLGELSDVEAKAEGIYERLMIPFGKHFFVRPEMLDEAGKGMKLIDEFRKKYDSFWLRYYHFSLRLLVLQLRAEFEDAVKECDTFIHYLEENDKFNSPVHIGYALLQKLDNLILLKNYTIGADCANACFRIFPAGHPNWFLTQHLYFIICLNTGKLVEAAGIYKHCISHSKFKKLPQRQQECWYINAGFLGYALECAAEYELRQSIFKKKLSAIVAKLMNEIPVYSQDRQGLNNSVLVLQLLSLLQEKQEGNIISRTEAIKTYISTHLSSEQYRTRLFIRLLIWLSSHHPEKDAGNLHFQKMLRELQESKRFITTIQAQMEIIDYNALWEMAVVSVLRLKGQENQPVV